MAARREIGGGRVVSAHPSRHSGMAETDRQHRLSDAWRADQQHVGGVFDKAQRCELVDQLFVHRRLGGEVEVGEGERRRQRGKARQAHPSAFIDSVDLEREEPLQEPLVGELGLDRVVELARERLGSCGHAQESQVRTQLLILRALGHADTCAMLGNARAMMFAISASPTTVAIESAPSWE